MDIKEKVTKLCHTLIKCILKMYIMDMDMFTPFMVSSMKVKKAIPLLPSFAGEEKGVRDSCDQLE